MIRVKVDIVPYGIEEHAEQIGELVLANIASLGMGTAAYSAAYNIAGRDPVIVPKVTHFRQAGFWELIRIILSSKETVRIEDLVKGKDDTLLRLIDRLPIYDSKARD
jgi:hypothetical protein